MWSYRGQNSRCIDKNAANDRFNAGTFALHMNSFIGGIFQKTVGFASLLYHCLHCTGFICGIYGSKLVRSGSSRLDRAVR